ncbi:hypothetical protein LAZ67_2005666 [Cordylochernes scorpioides]|uniref:Mariner Mos1 transposase n=1 Tax=Cordylochernes scorpioides TaxID=51811 RepID=A0ABY6K7V0_9ARAC|nr:hypothetical protein LAZ67_2005666 [Cordylochernes scorpioides]
MIKLKLKLLLINFFDVKRLVHYEFVPEGQTNNQNYYLDVLRRLREAVRQKRPEKWPQKNWLLHHDNARLYYPTQPFNEGNITDVHHAIADRIRVLRGENKRVRVNKIINTRKSIIIKTSDKKESNFQNKKN